MYFKFVFITFAPIPFPLFFFLPFVIYFRDLAPTELFAVAVLYSGFASMLWLRASLLRVIALAPRTGFRY